MADVSGLKPLAFLLCTALLGGCGCQDECAPCPVSGVTLAFDTDSLNNGFRRAEIRTAYVVRYALNDYQQPLDTVRQQLGQGLSFYSFGFSSFTLDRLFAPRPGAPNDPTRYSYRVLVPAAARQYNVTDLEIAGEAGDGCCGCYYNTRRRFRLDGRYVVVDGENSPSTTLTR